MCGITGKIYFKNNSQIVSRDNIEEMNRAIAHRGPDDSGFYITPNDKLGLGQQRLSIIDLSPLGHQPMHYEHNGKKYTIVFNGEIYNFQEERDFLKKEGYTFKSKTDTEVIMALYDQHGLDFLQHLRGMFAFALYDHQKNKLICARDRLGKKPFKYYIDNNTFMFASELKSILTQPEYKKEIDYVAIHHYLTLQYVPAPLTGFKDIKKLEPAHYLIIDCETGTVRKEKYWQLDYTKKLKLSEKEWEDKILTGLEEATKLRMISDVPLGAFLSGGIDSSAVVALMAKNSSQPIKTFSIGFNESDHDETAYAQLIADKYKTDHTKFTVKPDIIKLLPTLVKQYEEPYADPSAMPTYYLAQKTREHVTVALNGDGGDENFAGYQRYSIEKFSLWYDKITFLHKLLILPSFNLAMRLSNFTILKKGNFFMRSFLLPYDRRYVSYTQSFSKNLKKSLYKNKNTYSDTTDIIVSYFNSANAHDKLDKMLSADISTYLSEDLLPKIDMATMAHGLESRSPFLDHKFMEMTSQIPFNLKLRGLTNKKYILKKALGKNLIPKEILNHKKMGFSMPLDHWFRNELKDYIHTTLLSDTTKLNSFIDKKFISNMLYAHCYDNRNFATRIWPLLTLELWLKEFFN